jgi:transcriptional regulator with XRE-family HTH domain
METKEKSMTYGKRQAPERLTLEVDTFTPESVNPNKGLGGRLKEARQRLGVTQATLAETSGIPLKTYKKYEGDLILPGAEALTGLMKGGGINLHWLLTGEGPMLLKDMEETGPPPAVDGEVLAGVIEGVESALAGRRLALEPAKKAHLIGVLYDYIKATGTLTTADVARFLKLVT